jgi:hypothetical protein
MFYNILLEKKKRKRWKKMANNEIADIKSRLNSSNMLTAILHTLGSVEVKQEELQKILNYQKPEHLMNLNVDATYKEDFMDYIKYRGGYASLVYDEKLQTIKFTLMSREDAEKELKNNKSIGFVCVRSYWNDYAHS